MITLQSRAYNKNKCNLITRSDGGADQLTWCLNTHADYSFLIRSLIRHFTVMHTRFTLTRPLHDKNLVEKGTKLYMKTY